LRSDPSPNPIGYVCKFGGEGIVLKKRKKQVEGIEKFGREGV
jgi:hypothetical protein